MADILGVLPMIGEVCTVLGFVSLILPIIFNAVSKVLRDTFGLFGVGRFRSSFYRASKIPVFISR